MPIPVLAVLRKDAPRAAERTRGVRRARSSDALARDDSRASVATARPARPPAPRTTRVSDVDRDDDVMAPTTW